MPTYLPSSFDGLPPGTFHTFHNPGDRNHILVSTGSVSRVVRWPTRLTFLPDPDKNPPRGFLLYPLPSTLSSTRNRGQGPWKVMFVPGLVSSQNCVLLLLLPLNIPNFSRFFKPFSSQGQLHGLVVRSSTCFQEYLSLFSRKPPPCTSRSPELHLVYARVEPQAAQNLLGRYYHREQPAFPKVCMCCRHPQPAFGFLTTSQPPLCTTYYPWRGRQALAVFASWLGRAPHKV